MEARSVYRQTDSREKQDRSLDSPLQTHSDQKTQWSAGPIIWTQSLKRSYTHFRHICWILQRKCEYIFYISFEFYRMFFWCSRLSEELRRLLYFTSETSVKWSESSPVIRLLVVLLVFKGWGWCDSVFFFFSTSLLERSNVFTDQLSRTQMYSVYSVHKTERSTREWKRQFKGLYVGQKNHCEKTNINMI